MVLKTSYFFSVYFWFYVVIKIILFSFRIWMSVNNRASIEQDHM